MKLIVEDPLMLDGSIEEIMNESTGAKERNYYISGIFSTPGTKNRNGRVYSRAIWEREVKKYQKELDENTTNTLGEWQHPPRSTVDPSKAVIKIVELRIDEVGNVVGKAKILNDNTELTNKLKGLIKEGIKIGVSSRGVGSVSATGVVEDFKLITYDAVDMPSDYNAMLNGVVEGVQFVDGIAQDKEYTITESGCIGEACTLENKETPCPLEEKMNEKISIAKDEIYTIMDVYLKEYFKKIEKDKDLLINSISEYLEDRKEVIVDVVENTEVEKEYNLVLEEELKIAFSALSKNIK